MAISQAKKLELITKHGRKFAAKNGSATPVLEGAHYGADGSIVTTDCHKLLRIGGAHNFTEPFTSHAVTGAPISGDYPDTSKFIPMELPTQITLYDIKDAIARVKLAVDIAKAIGDKLSIVTLTTESLAAKLSINNDDNAMYYTAALPGDLYGEGKTVLLNAAYLLDALNVFKDAGSARVIIGLIGPLSPIVLRDEENEIDAIVLPYRRAGGA
ncbi:hypothetical protein [Paenibacillus naphthalenovorans]|uniref:hypothetical protein n=1 Tax=Paenibacillus naphthalenovorans TaxID=162209 RepID=UPI003D2705CB